LCNLFTPKNKKLDSLVVYLHGYMGNLLEGIPVLEKILPDKSVLLMDLPAHGNSELNTSTLGVTEAEDLLNILREVICYFNFSNIFLWGRCIGAVTIINALHSLFLNRETNPLTIVKCISY